MRFSSFKWLVILALAGLVLTACNPNKPDLIPERRSGSQGAEGFCRTDDDGNLVVRVRNQTNFDNLNPSTTIVEFSPGTPQSAVTAPMPGGSMTDVTFVFPAGCFNPDCDFTITVDANGDVDEGDEGNNTVAGTCIG